MKKNKVITVRVSEEEHDLVIQAAGGEPISKFILGLVFERVAGHVDPVVVTKNGHPGWHVISRIGDRIAIGHSNIRKPDVIGPGHPDYQHFADLKVGESA